MKIAVMGCDGFIAANMIPKLKEEQWDVLPLSNTVSDEICHIDLADLEGFNFKKLDDVDCVVFTAAISSPDACEKDYDFCYHINVRGSRTFIEEAIKRNTKVLFFSSDAVYGNDLKKPFDENSETNPISAYGKMKREIEMSFEGEPNFKAIRLSYAFSAGDKFTKYYLSCVREQKQAEIFHPFYRSMICLRDLIRLVIYLIKNWETTTPQILNACGSELVSRVRVADLINRHLSVQGEYIISKMQGDFLRIRPEITQLSSLYLPDIFEDYYEPFDVKALHEIKNILF